MDILIKEEYIRGTVTEFEKFCDYIAVNKPAATDRGHLPVKTCDEMNRNSLHPIQTHKKRAFMDDYPSLMLWFQLGLGMGLLEYNNDRKGKPSIETTAIYAPYKALGAFSKYYALFAAWYLDLNHKSIYKDDNIRHMQTHRALSYTFEAFPDHIDYEWIQRREYYTAFGGEDDGFLQMLMNLFPQVLRHFMDFGWVECREDVRVGPHSYGIYPIVQSLRITPLGKILADASETRTFYWMNRFETPYMDKEALKQYNKLMRAIKSKKEGPLDPFVACFPAGSIDFKTLNALLGSQNDDKPPFAYDCYLSYGRKFSCVIRCASTHTFEDLHKAIQKAVEFDNDHMYSFYLDGKRFSDNAVNCPHNDYSAPQADTCTLAEARLRNNQRIMYLFDFGDEWKFLLTIKEVKEKVDLPAKPIIMNIKGKPPEQYPSWDE